MTYEPPNYGTITQAGETRRRIWRGQEENSLSEVYQLYHEQTAIGVSDGDGGFTEEVLRDEGTIRVLPSAEFQATAITMRDPTTDSAIPDAYYDAISNTGAGLYIAKYSMGRWAQEMRDNYYLSLEANALPEDDEDWSEVWGLNPDTGEFIPEPVEE